MSTIFNADEAIRTLTEKADEAGLDAADLDELVHDIASGIAADANNGGLEAQIAFIVSQLGPEGVKNVAEIVGAQ